jgi:hypothetical protein
MLLPGYPAVYVVLDERIDRTNVWQHPRRMAEVGQPLGFSNKIEIGLREQEPKSTVH